MRYLYLTLLIFLCACAGLKRSPSSIGKNETIFNLINSENLLSTSYNFELVSLYSLNDKKIVFKNYDVVLPGSRKAFDVWSADLHSFLSILKADLPFRVGNKILILKVQDLQRLEQALTLLARSPEPAEAIFRKQVELVTAFNQKFKNPESSSFQSIPIEFSGTTIGQQNQIVYDSSFWQNPAEKKRSLAASNVSAENLVKLNCKSEASEPTAIKLNCNSQRLLIQDQESPKVAALNSALYRRLGFNVSDVVYLHTLELNYDRGLLPLLENLKVRPQVRMKTGELLKFSEITKKLIPYCKSEAKCHSNSALYDAAVESQFDKIVLNGIAVTIDYGDHVFGSWGLDELDHRSRPEVKALLFAGALTGNSDLRKESYAVVWSANNFAITHQIQNVSSGLGRFRPGTSMNLNAMNWDVLKKKNSKAGAVFVFDGYRPAVKVKAFSDLKYGDAVWSVRQIAGISEDEITEILAASGFSAAELILAREKMISIQKNLVETLGIANEFPVLAARKINKYLNYKLQGQSQIFELSANRKLQVPVNNDELINGILRKPATSEK